MTLEEILDKLTCWIRKYVILPGNYGAEVIALWAVHTWVVTSFYSTPRLVFSSPQPGSGKTRALELLAIVSFQGKMTISSSSAALFRRIGKAHRDDLVPPTILFDETDATFGASRPSEQTEQLRALMNAGYKRGATVDRCEGDAANMQIVEWPVFSALALAGLAGKLPDTITSRAVVMEMKKRAPGERVAPFRERDARFEIAPTVAAISAWAPKATAPLTNARPQLPEGVVDRPAEVWEPLVAVADMAGGKWPEIARKACLEFVFAPTRRIPSIGIELLSDIREIMGHGESEEYFPVDRMRTKELLRKLYDLDESPWKDLGYGKMLDARRLSQILAGYEVGRTTFKDGSTSAKGYVTFGTKDQAGLADAWLRYLPPPHAKVGNSGNSVTEQVTGGKNQQTRLPVTGNQTSSEETGYLPQSVTGRQEVTENSAPTSAVTEDTGITDFAEGAQTPRNRKKGAA